MKTDSIKSSFHSPDFGALVGVLEGIEPSLLTIHANKDLDESDESDTPKVSLA
jgi:hypothetical protein